MQKRKINCYHCRQELLVSSRAFSVVCSGCNQRVSVEDFIISSGHTTHRIETCGSLLVTDKGILRSRLRVYNVMVQGQLFGNVVADGKVTLTAGAHLEGDITANRLEVNNGARLYGFCRIEPGKCEIPTNHSPATM